MVDFTGTDPQVPGSINAVYAVTWSAVFYVFRCLLAARRHRDRRTDAARPGDRARTVPSSTPRPPAAVAGGNVETSQRIVDTLLRALAAGAARSHSRRKLRHHEQSHDRRHRSAAPASPTRITKPSPAALEPRRNRPGASGHHAHMTNSLNTPVEALEYAYPFRMIRYAIRPNPAEQGSTAAATASSAKSNCSAMRRSRFSPIAAPLNHGDSPEEIRREKGNTSIIANGEEQSIPGKCTRELKSGTRIRIESPGGGGWGKG